MFGDHAKHRRRLEQLQRAAAAGDQGAAGEARSLAEWLREEDERAAKTADDHAKIIGGVWLAREVEAGRIDPHDLLRDLGELLQGKHREKILGPDEQGSPAFWRVYGRSQEKQ